MKLTVPHVNLFLVSDGLMVAKLCNILTYANFACVLFCVIAGISELLCDRCKRAVQEMPGHLIRFMIQIPVPVPVRKCWQTYFCEVAEICKKEWREIPQFCTYALRHTKPVKEAVVVGKNHVLSLLVHFLVKFVLPSREFLRGIDTVSYEPGLREFLLLRSDMCCQQTEIACLLTMFWHRFRRA